MTRASAADRDPLITLITPCLDGRAFIPAMLASAHDEQGDAAIEHIVLDAGSTDGTREFLEAQTGIRLIAEPDAGSHDAMNKGIGLARGAILGFINADDLYAPGILAEIAARFAAEPALDAVLGRSYLLAEAASGWQVAERHPLCAGGGFDLRDLMYGIPCINARFFRRRVFDRFGDFSAEFSFAADRHLLLRLALGGVRGAVLDRPAYFYRRHAGSRTLDPGRRNAVALGREHVAIAEALLAAGAGSPHDRLALLGWRSYEQLRAAFAGQSGGSTRSGLPASLPEAAAVLRGVAAKLAVRRRRRRDRPMAPLPASALPRSLVSPAAAG